MTGVAWILLLIGVVFTGDPRMQQVIRKLFCDGKVIAVRIEPDCRVERRGIKENH